MGMKIYFSPSFLNHEWQQKVTKHVYGNTSLLFCVVWDWFSFVPGSSVQSFMLDVKIGVEGA